MTARSIFPAVPGRAVFLVSMRRALVVTAIAIASLSVGTVRADDSPKYAERGVQAYNAGKYDLARLFFTKALQDAILKGKEDWIAKATLNLADLEIETMEEAEAARLLDGFSTHNRGLLALALWKKSQLAFLQRRYPDALSKIDSALALAAGDQAKETSMRLDRMRYLIQSRDPKEWAADFEACKKSLSRSDRGRAASVEAAADMARRDFKKADTLWRDAANYYRDQGRLAKVAACLNQLAVCLFSEGNRADAVDVNARAVAIYGELGLDIPGLRAQALRLFLVEDERELAKIRQDMDLLGQRFGGFDLQGILDEYSHSLHVGRLGPDSGLGP